MSNEESKDDVAKEARELISKCAILAMPQSYGDPNVATFDGATRIDGLLSALIDQFLELRRCNATQEESITHLQSQQRVMKEAIEDGIQRLEDNERWWYDARLIAELTPFQKDAFKARAQVSRRALDILRSAITPNPSER